MSAKQGSIDEKFEEWLQTEADDYCKARPQIAKAAYLHGVSVGREDMREECAKKCDQMKYATGAGISRVIRSMK